MEMVTGQQRCGGGGGFGWAKMIWIEMEMISKGEEVEQEVVSRDEELEVEQQMVGEALLLALPLRSLPCLVIGPIYH